MAEELQPGDRTEMAEQSLSLGHAAAAALLAWAAASLACAAAAPAQEAVPLLNLRYSVQEMTIESFQLDLELAGLMPNGASFRTSLTRSEGKWHIPADGHAPRYNTARHAVDPAGLKVSDDRIAGTIRLTVQPDKSVPEDGKQRQLDAAIDGRIIRSGRSWSLKGTYEASVEGGRRSGEVTGTFDRAKRNGRWNLGTWDDGVAVRLDLGTRRVNWNHARSTVCTFDPPRDLSRYAALRIRIATESPRDDAEVAVWLGEADGSWYYVKSAVPLVDRLNEAVLPFADFDVAEWVAPGNHMDEDFLLDLKSIGAIAIGVVNPLGVGEVAFKITGIWLVPAGPPPPPATVRVTGRTLSVNGHDRAQPGIFGGYANDLPQQYRPGCQRNLYAPSYPNTPRQRFASFREGSFSDWPAMMRALRGEAEAHRKLSGHLLGLIDDDRLLERLKRFDIDRHLQRARKSSRKGDADRPPRELTDPLNRMLRSPRLYQAGAWAGVKLPERLEPRLRKLTQGELNDTELMELNRRLLEAAFGRLIHPAGEHGPSEAFYIDCFGERKNTAILLHEANWKGFFEDYGRKLAENARKAGCAPGGDVEVHWEFWNEPYLHWGTKDRVNLQTKWYRTDLAKEGGPVMVKRTGPDGQLIPGEVIPHFRWVRGEDPKALRDAVGGLYIEDETAFTFWSGSGNGWIYDQMLSAVAPAIKKHNPSVQVIAGWGFRWQEDHWDAWRLLYRNTIDRNIRWIDGVHEHHYQGQTTGMNGAYEVLTCYGVTKHHKWLYGYNTETNDLIDTPARGAVDTPEKARASTEYRRMIYNLRDLLYCVQESSDKFKARTMIHPYRSPKATDVCFGLLQDLRGRRLEVRRDPNDDKVWAVASLDGTDPKAMPPAFDGTVRLVVVVYNDHRFARKVRLAIDAPTGTTFGEAFAERTTMDGGTFGIARPRQDNVRVGKTAAAFELELAHHSAWKISIALAGKLAERPEVQRRQYFSPDILKVIRRGRPVSTTVELDAKALATADRAWLRAVVEDVGIGEGVAVVCGQRLALPRAFVSDNVSKIVEVPLDLKALRPRAELTFATAPGNHAGYRLDMASIVLEHRARDERAEAGAAAPANATRRP
jgi:hypothetical protein